MLQCENLILYTQFFVKHWLVIVEEPQVSQGSGQHCFSLGGVNILDDEQRIIWCTLMLPRPVRLTTACVCFLRSSLINGILVYTDETLFFFGRL